MEHNPRFYTDFGKPFTNKDVYVTFFRKKYNYLDIEKVYKELYSNNNFISIGEWDDNIDSINAKNKLSDYEKEELKKYNLKMESSSWLSRQRSLRRKGKLSEQQINKLNKLGMVWDPTNNEWEKNFQKYKKEGFIFDIRKWVNDQIIENNNEKMPKENKIRLEAVNFPFKGIDPTSFKHTWTSFYILEKKMKNKINEMSTTVRTDHSQSRTYVPSKKVSKEDAKIELENKKYNNHIGMWHECYWSVCESIPDLSDKKNFDLISGVLEGKSICIENRIQFLDEVVKKNIYQKNKIPSGYSYSDVNRIDSDIGKYKELTYFNKANVNPKIRSHACEQMLKFYEILVKDYDYRNIKHFPPLKYLISNYYKNKNNEGLNYLLDYISEYPKLKVLYSEKINHYIKKLNS